MKTDKLRMRGFSLIELLVAVAIVGVLFAVGLAVFANAGKRNPERGATTLMTTLRLARQHAIAQRQWTFAVFPNRDGGAYAGNDLVKCLRGFAVLAVANDMERLDKTAQIPANMDFAFVTDWTYLPEGITFDDDPALPGNFTFGAPNGAQDTYTGAFLFPLDPAQPHVLVRPMGAVLFKPNGRAYVMHDNSPSGSYWQDVDGSKIHVTAAKAYGEAGGALTGPDPVPGGTTVVVRIRNKTGQVEIWDGGP